MIRNLTINEDDVDHLVTQFTQKHYSTQSLTLAGIKTLLDEYIFMFLSWFHTKTHLSLDKPDSFSTGEVLFTYLF